MATIFYKGEKRTGGRYKQEKACVADKGVENINAKAKLKKG